MLVLHLPSLRATLNLLLSHLGPWVLVILFFVPEGSYGLVCWHCISDGCEVNPEENERAEQKSCLQGQTCQKVQFEMKNDSAENYYRSTVRSCADECIPHDDFDNCTDELLTTRGCVTRACCADDDLCNTSPKTAQLWSKLCLLTSMSSWILFAELGTFLAI